MRNYNEIISRAYDVLKPNCKYWQLDNDYRRYYNYVREAVEKSPNYSDGVLEYIAVRALFLINAHNRIFHQNVSIV